jgi:hypothetical protein
MEGGVEANPSRQIEPNIIIIINTRSKTHISAKHIVHRHPIPAPGSEQQKKIHLSPNGNCKHMEETRGSDKKAPPQNQKTKKPKKKKKNGCART